MLKGKKVSILIAMREEFHSAKLQGGHFVHYINVGKVNAALAAQKSIDLDGPDIILNLGAAGSSKFQYGEVVNCTKFIQRDMDLTSLGYGKYITPDDAVSSDAVLEYGLGLEGMAHGVCGTGDSFVAGRMPDGCDLVDMEAYAIAKACKAAGVPFLCVKFVSDGADKNAPDDFHAVLESVDKVLGEAYEGLCDE